MKNSKLHRGVGGMNRLQPRILTDSALGVCQAGQQKLFLYDNERVAKELNELADTIEVGQKAKEEWKI